MQCGCPECGNLMAKRERGLKSECVCNWCGATCALCIGKPTDASPLLKPGMSPREWEELLNGINGEPSPHRKEHS